MEIIKTSENLTNREIYALTMSPSNRKMKDAIAQQIGVYRWCLYKDINGKDGTEQTILAIMTPEKEVFCTNSQTFMRDFERIWDIMQDDVANGELLEIKVIVGESKSGREFVTCTLAEF